MSYKPHQIEKSLELLNVLKLERLAYLYGKPRSGKSRTAIKTALDYGSSNILVITKKAAIPGWQSELEAVNEEDSFTVTNYEQCKRINAKTFDLVIVDEAHTLGKVGKPTQKFKEVHKIAFGKPVILLSGTPAVESKLRLYYQLRISKWTPFDFPNFYAFFREYGIPHQIYIRGNKIEQYDQYKPELLEELEPYLVRMDEQDAGIKTKQIDKLHIVELDHATKMLIEEIEEDLVIYLDGEDIGFDSDMAVRAAVHQAEYGALLVKGDIKFLGNTEVVDYLLKTFGDNQRNAFMTHFRSTRELLKKHLPNSIHLSSQGHCEGVDLAGYDNFVIVNTGYSGSSHIQRIARNSNMSNEKDAIVHHIVTDAGISKAVYNAVNSKRDFNISHYRKLYARAATTKENTGLP